MSLVIHSSISQKVSMLANQVAAEAHHRFGKNIPVYWFGSWVNGNASPKSDLDIGIDVSRTTRASEFLDFVDWVEFLPTLYRFDIINMSEISDSFRNKIITTGRLL
jgi:predicted nucleotidyltransferase